MYILTELCGNVSETRTIKKLLYETRTFTYIQETFTLQIEDYSHDYSHDSSAESEESQRNEDVDLEDDVLDLEDDVSYTEDSMLAHGGFKCIACQNTTFKNNKTEQYIEHLRYG